MAGGGSPRQRMINLMYLVFIAMLALNMGKQVLSSFGYLNEKISDSNTNTAGELDLILTDLKTKASEQPEKWADKNNVASEVHKLSQEFYNHVASIKDTLVSGVEDTSNFETMDTETPGNEFFFKGEEFTPNGDKFLEMIRNYTKRISEITGSSNETKGLVSKIQKRFDTEDINVEGGKQPWLKNRYEGFPLIATVTNLSVMQADIRTTEKEIYNALIGKQLAADAGISASTYQSIVIPDKPAYFEGETFSGKVVLGRYDSSLKPEDVIVNGSKVTGRDAETGAALVKFRAGKPGENPIKGEFHFRQDGELVTIPINSTYVVVPKPDRAVVSADKMNVVYRGVQNPITISIPGIPDNKIVATAPGLKKAPGVGKYMLSPGVGREVKINVSGTTQDGTKITSPAVTFRIKDIPAPRASIRKQNGVIKMPKSSLSKAVVGADLVDFDFDLKLKVNSFKLKVPGQPTVSVRGAKMDAKAVRALSKARTGDQISIFDVKSEIIGNSSYRLKGTLSLIVEINN